MGYAPMSIIDDKKSLRGDPAAAATPAAGIADSAKPAEPAASTAQQTLPIEIPEELVSAGARFILVRKREKSAFENDWQTTANYSADSPRLQAHLAAGGNYGVLSHNNIGTIDVDIPDEFTKLDPNLGATFAVMRGDSGRTHIYFIVGDDCPPDKRGKFETPFGDVRTGGNFYVVGANCIHPSGDTYNIFRRVPLAVIPWAEIERLIAAKPRGRLTGHGSSGDTSFEGSFELPDVIRESQPGRNKTLFAYGCSLQANGVDIADIAKLVQEANRTRCKPEPLPDDELNTLLHSVARLPKPVIVICKNKFPDAPPRVIPEPSENCKKSMHPCECRIGRFDTITDVTMTEAHGKFAVYNENKKTKIVYSDLPLVILSVVSKSKTIEKIVEISARFNARCDEPLSALKLDSLREYIIHDYLKSVERPEEERAAFNPHEYAERLKEIFHFVYFNKVIYIYDEENHVYRKQTNEIETHARNTLHDEYGIDDDLSSQLTEIKAHVTSMGSCKEFPFNVSKTDIPVLNGIVRINYDTEEITLLPHGYEHLFTYKLNVTYDPTVDRKLARDLLRRMVELPDVKTLLQIPAQSLLQMQTGHAYKKAYLLQGEPHSGKTSFLKMLYRLFGDDYTAAASLQQLCDDKFVGGKLEGKLLNAYDDLEDVALRTIDQFKAFTGDCRQGIERKFESGYVGQITCVNVFSCNYPPEYPPKVRRDSAFWCRWEYVKFPFSYPVNPNFYVEWYTPERFSSFLNMVLSTMIQIKKRGLLSNSEAKDVMLVWTVNSDPLHEYLHTVFEPYEGRTPLRLHKVKLHNHYKQWCSDEDIPEHKRLDTIRSFTVALQAHNITVDRIRLGKDDRPEVYSTLSYIRRGGVTVDLNPATELPKESEASTEPITTETTSGVYASGQGTIPH
jgi:phage/plasmid-associated DNA primase